MAGKYCLPRTASLRGGEAFNKVFANRDAIRGTWLSLHRGKPVTGSAAQPRLGLIVAKRLCPRANRRNLIKRLVRESFRRFRGDLGGADLVLRLTHKLPAESRPTLRRLLGAEVARLFARLGNQRKREA